MSTRGVYSFIDNDPEWGMGDGRTYHVYKHSDNYPTRAAKSIKQALIFAWHLPRYEADEFAAAFITANKLPWWCDDQFIEGIEKTRKPENLKKSNANRFGGNIGEAIVKLENPYPDSDLSGGGVRLLHSGRGQEVYDVAPGDIEYRYEIYKGNQNELRVKAFSTNFWDNANPENEEMIFDCSIDDLEERAKEYENRNE